MAHRFTHTKIALQTNDAWVYYRWICVDLETKFESEVKSSEIQTDYSNNDNERCMKNANKKVKFRVIGIFRIRSIFNESNAHSSFALFCVHALGHVNNLLWIAPHVSHLLLAFAINEFAHLALIFLYSFICLPNTYPSQRNRAFRQLKIFSQLKMVLCWHQCIWNRNE